MPADGYVKVIFTHHMSHHTRHIFQSMRVVFPTGEVQELSSSSSSSSSPTVFDLCCVAMGSICVVDEVTCDV